ncbi:hypothetical protein J1N35_018971 [Gossypium stocksii]|uniref:Uncharacterized protein n=1 Tax=Gossypium stocksii TaxID=47602 RepID=A0A9D3VQH7_9ROSI|nr:hypothetical protein J1N35_018971 [Gossypium stocksii]
MKGFLGSQDCWDIVKEKYVKLENAVAKAALTNEEKIVLKEVRKNDKRTFFFIFQRVDKSNIEKNLDVKTSNHGEFCKNSFKELKRPKKVHLQTLKAKFETLRMKVSESIDDYVT